MKITILGASGATGKELVKQALAEGHDVTAFVRNPQSVDQFADRISVVDGDVMEVATLEPAIQGRDAVLSALGPPRDNNADARTVTAVENVVSCMERLGTRRLIHLSAFGVGDSRAQTSFIFRNVAFPLLKLKALYTIKEREEEVIRRSNGLDWTIVRAAKLSDKPAKGASRIIEGRGKAYEQIARADVASFMLSQLEDDRFRRKAVAIAW